MHRRVLIALAVGGGLVACHAPTASATEVGGNIVSDATWTKTGSPYVVVSNVYVTNQAILTIEPGVEVRFQPTVYLQVGTPVLGAGTIVARGTSSPADTIVLTSNKATPAPGDWGGIRFTEQAVSAVHDSVTGAYLRGCILEYCRIAYAFGAINSLSTSPHIGHALIQNNTVGTDHEGGGMYCIGGSPVLRAVIFRSNTAGSGAGMYCHGSAAILDSVVFENNSANRWSGGVWPPGGLYVYHGSPSLSTLIFRGNSGPTAALTLNAAASIMDGAVVTNNSSPQGAAVWCEGGVLKRVWIAQNQCRGLEGNPERLDSCTVLGNSRAGIWGTPGVLSSCVVSFNGGDGLRESSPDTVVNCTITGNAGDGIEGSPAVVRGCTISRNVGNGVYGCPGGLSCCNIWGNESGYDLRLTGSISQTYANNWWGTTDSSQVAEHIFDFWEDGNIGFVIFAPYLLAICDSAPGQPRTVAAVRLMADESYEEDLGWDLWLGATLYVQLSGTDVSPYSLDQTTVQVTSDSDPSGIVLVLTETGESTGVFRGAAVLSDAAPSNDTTEVIYCAIGDSVHVVSRVDLTKQDVARVGQNPTGVTGAETIPVEMSLVGNFPNPVLSGTVIAFSVAKESRVRLGVYDVSGQLVKTLLDESLHPGFHTVAWNGRDSDGNEAFSGVYLYRLESGGRCLTKKALIMRGR